MTPRDIQRERIKRVLADLANNIEIREVACRNDMTLERVKHLQRHGHACS
jgi:hypothetical protein